MLAINAKNRLALSGTPIENSATDIWTIFRFLMPGLLEKENENELSKDSQERINLFRSKFLLSHCRQSNKWPRNSSKIDRNTHILNLEQKKVYRLLAEQGILEDGNNLQDAVNNSPTHVFSLLTRLIKLLRS